MAKKHKQATPTHAIPSKNQKGSDPVASATLKDLRKRAGLTQEELATALGVGQDTISRLEKRSDMLLSTLRHYIECIGGRLELIVTLPDQSSVVIDCHNPKDNTPQKRGRKPPGVDSPT